MTKTLKLHSEDGIFQVNRVYFTYIWIADFIFGGVSARGGCTPAHAGLRIDGCDVNCPRGGYRVHVLLSYQFSFSTSSLHPTLLLPQSRWDVHHPLGSWLHPGALFSVSTHLAGSRNRSGSGVGWEARPMAGQISLLANYRNTVRYDGTTPPFPAVVPLLL